MGEVVTRFEKRGYKLIGMKIFKPAKDLLEDHYKELNKKPFFPGLIEYMSSGPVVPMVKKKFCFLFSF